MIDCLLNPFNVKDGKAYTEDGVLVYTVYFPIVVYNYYDRSSQIKRYSLNLTNIAEHFDKYGPVASVNVGSSKKYKFEYQYALITFEKAEDARHALNDIAGYIIRGYEMHILGPANSWEQPFSEEMIRMRRESYKGPVSVEESPIFGLNDDCLMYLYSYLDLAEGYKVSRLCERFEQVFEGSFKRLHKEIRLIKTATMTLLEWQQILKQYGHLIQLLDISDCRFSDYIPTFCPNVKTFLVHEFILLSENYFHDIASNMKSLHTIKLCGEFIDDDIMLLLSRMDTIKSLRLESTNISGLHMDSFQHLEHLQIGYNKSLNTQLLNQMFEKVTTLTKVEYISNDISNITIQTIAQFGGNIRELSILANCCNIEPLARLSNLHSLKISNIRTMLSDHFFSNLAANLKHKLRVLHLGLLRHLTNVQVESIFKLTALEEFSIDKNVDDQFLSKMSAFTNLKCFRAELSSSVKVQAIVDFISNAPLLEKLAICNYVIYNIYSLVESIISLFQTENRKPNKPFHLVIRDVEKDDVLKHIMLAHKDLIKITC